MRLRFSLAIAATVLTLAPALAEPPKPAIVVQAVPVSRLLSEYREMLRQVSGPVEAERAVKGFDRELKEALGEQGFEGVDINRPLAAYSVLREKIDETTLVMVVPVTSEKDFLAFLERLKITTEAVKDQKGLYKCSAEKLIDLFPIHHVRFVDGGWAYIGAFGDEVTDAKNLVPPSSLFNNADQSLFSAKIYPDRVPEKLLKHLLEELETTAAGIKGFVGLGGTPKHIIKMAVTICDEGPKLVRRYAETGLKEAAEVGVRFSWEPMTGETFTELTLVPKPGTPLAKEITAIPTTANRFAGLVPKDAAVGVVVKAPLFAKELQEIVAVLLEAGQEELKTESGLAKAFHPVVDEVAKSLIGSVKKGTLDGAVALVGPNKDGKFTIVGGVSLDDAAAVDQALRKAGQLAALVKLVEFDAAKVGTVSIHKVSLITAFPEDVRGDLAKVFGENPPGYVAFDKDAVFVAAGPDALATIKAAIEAKPGPAPAIDVTGNMKRLHKLVAAAADEKIAGIFAKHMGTDDKTANMFRVTVEGGQTLKAKATMNLRYLPRVFVVGEAIDNELRKEKPPAK